MSRVVLISGASSGIGAEIARAFKRRDWVVLGIDLRPIDPGLCDRSAVGDISEERTWSAAAELIRSGEDRLDALVLNAAVQDAKPIQSTTLADWERVLKVNVGGVFLGAREMHPWLASSRGAIVAVGSVHSIATSAGMAAYVSSKGAVAALTRALALEFAADGIRVNAVLPGAVDTDMLAEGLQRPGLPGDTVENRRRRLAARTPLGRLGRPSDIAAAACFLADDDQAGFITGQCLVVDGGATARLGTE